MDRLRPLLPEPEIHEYLVLIEKDQRFAGLSAEHRVELADWIAVAARKLVAHLQVESRVPKRASLVTDLERLGAIARTLSARALAGQRCGRQGVALSGALEGLGGVGRLALAEAAAEPDNLAAGHELVDHALRVIRSAQTNDGSGPDAALAEEAAKLWHWASLAHRARASLPPPMARPGFAARQFAFSLLEAVKEVTGHRATAGRQTDTQAKPGEIGTASLKFVAACFAVVRAGIAMAEDPDLRALSGASELQPTAETLIEWTFAFRGAPRQHRGQKAKSRLRKRLAHRRPDR